MTTGEHDTARFEERLLVELQQLIVARETSDAGLQKHRRNAWRRRLVLSAAVVIGLAVALAVLLPSGSTPAFAITRGKDGTVTVVIHSFQEPAELEHGLRTAGVPAMVQLLPAGKDCSAPPSWTAVPASELPSFDPAKHPHANPPIDVGGGGRHPITLILQSIPPDATLVIESAAESPELALAWPAAKKGMGIQPLNSRGIYVVWAEGHVKPCKVVNTS